MSRKIGALWIRQTQDGKVYLSGILEDLRGQIQIAVFKNDRKEKENQPDYQILLSEKTERKEKKQTDDFISTPARPEEYPTEDEINVEEIPF